MIAKRIPAPKGGAGFEALARYVVNARAGVDPASWERLSAYVLDANGQGEKVAWSRVSNCHNTDPGWAVKEILATQGRNTRSKSDKGYHLVVSFPEGERPRRAQIEDIEDCLVAAIGFADHQRVSAVHQNTDNWHLHVAINKVHPESLRNVAPFQDHFRLQQACAELEIRHGLTREAHTTSLEQARRQKARGRAADFAARHGAPSFLAWMQEHAAPALLAARVAGRGWTEVHRVAAAHGLVVKPRGAGLVIGHASDSRLHVKASEVDRGLSFRAMTEACGPYGPPGGDRTEPPRAAYARPQGSGPLWDAFRRQRATALAERDAATRALRGRHVAYAQELHAYYQARVARERQLGLRGALRRDAFRHIAEQRHMDDTARRAREAAERRELRVRHPIPNWQGWLEHQAGQGNAAALATLRSRQTRAQRIEAELLTAANADDARHVVHRHLRPAIRRDGRVIYRVADGGLVSDEARQVRVPQPSAAASYLALALAVERFGDRPLVVRGSEAFRWQVAELAGVKGMAVRFADPALERTSRGARDGGGRSDGVER